MTTARRRGFSTMEVVLVTSAMLVAVTLALPLLLAIVGSLPRPAAGGRDGSAVAARMEVVRQHVEGFRMRVIDAYDRRFNASMHSPCE